MLYEMSSFNKAYLEFTKTIKNFRFNKSDNHDNYNKNDNDNKSNIGYSSKNDGDLKVKGDKSKNDDRTSKNPFTDSNKSTAKNNKNETTKNQNSSNFSSFMFEEDFEDKEWAIKGDLSVADALVRTFKLASYRVRSFSTHCSQQANNNTQQLSVQQPLQFQQQSSPSQENKNLEQHTFSQDTKFDVQTVDQKTQRPSRNKTKKHDEKLATKHTQQHIQHNQQQPTQKQFTQQPTQQSTQQPTQQQFTQQPTQQTTQQQDNFNNPVPFTNPGTSNLFNSQIKDIKNNDIQQRDTQKSDIQKSDTQKSDTQNTATQQNTHTPPKPSSQPEYALVASEYVLMTGENSNANDAIDVNEGSDDRETFEEENNKIEVEIENSKKVECVNDNDEEDEDEEEEEEEEEDGSDDDGVGNAIMGLRNEINLVGRKFVKDESGDYKENKKNKIIKKDVIKKSKTQKQTHKPGKHILKETKGNKNNDEDKENSSIPPSLWLDKKLLKRLFRHIEVPQFRSIPQVCSVWRDVIYDRRDLWKKVEIRIFCKDLNRKVTLKNNFFNNLEHRKIPNLIFENITDPNVAEILKLCPYIQHGVTKLAIRNSNIGDEALKTLVEFATRVTDLELVSCNEVTEVGLWSCLPPRLHHLKLADCINVADDTVAAIGHLLSNLQSLNLQAYHVTNASLSTFSSKQSMYLKSLKLVSCWEVTNHGVVNVIRSLPNLTVLSLSGCSKVSDDGIEIVAENLKNLRELDLSWCPKVTDLSLEYISCGLNRLEKMVLDRCGYVSDVGVTYLSTMTSLTHLYLRWCCQVRDSALKHISRHNKLKVLSVAGCTQLTSEGLLLLGDMDCLIELELTNCFSGREGKATVKTLKKQLPNCVIIE